MFQQEISQLNLKQFKAGEKRWIGSLLGSSAALLFKEIAAQSPNLYMIVARNNQHLAQLESELEFYGINQRFFLIGKFCLTIVYLLIKILCRNVWRFYRICHKRVFYWFLQSTWLNVLRHIHGWWVNTLILKLDKDLIWSAEKQLVQAGYRLVDTVYDHGEFAVRGSIMDIYASGQDQPIRIDLFDDEIESLKFFDPETQRTTESLKTSPFTCKRISTERRAFHV